MIIIFYLLPLVWCNSCELRDIFHHPEVCLHLVGEPGEVAKLGYQSDQLGHVIFLCSLPLRSADQHRLLGVLDGYVVLLLVVLDEGRLPAVVILELAARRHVPVDVVHAIAAIVVPRQDDGPEQRLLHPGLHVRQLLRHHVLDEVVPGLGPQHLVADVAAEHDAALELLHRRHVAGPDFQLVLRHHVPGARIIEIFVHFHHFERVHDPPEQRVVELN